MLAQTLVQTFLICNINFIDFESALIRQNVLQRIGMKRPFVTHTHTHTHIRVRARGVLNYNIHILPMKKKVIHIGLIIAG